jgi:hypothetical protein
MFPRRIGSSFSLLAALAALALLVCAVVWPDWAEQLLRSRWAVVLVALQCQVVAVVLHPELRAGVAQGFRAVRDDLGRWL